MVRMNVNDKLADLQSLTTKKQLTFEMLLNEQRYPLHDVKILEIETPVNKPTVRGGIYYSDTTSFKLQGTIYDTSVIPKLSKKMLGPNTEFEEIKILAKHTSDANQNFSISTHLTNSMQRSSKVELNMTITKIE